MSRNAAGRPDLCLRLPATLKAIEGFFADLRAWQREIPDVPDCFAAELLLREALNNAVLHGCQGDPDKHILCRVRLDRRRLAVAIRDEGDGFDWRGASGRQAALSADSGRGLEIIRTYATRVRFNARGNAVTIIKRF